jgi:hypothetical protein
VQNAHLLPRTYEIPILSTYNSFKNIKKMKSLFLRTLTPFGSIKYNEKLKGESENRVRLSQE